MTTDTEPRTHWTGLVGRTDDGTRVYVEIELRHKDGGTWRTTEHEPVGPDGYLELSISGHTIRKGGRTCDSAGQILDDLTRVTRPEPGMVGRVDELAIVWDVWHLNGMQAGCAHQVPVYAPDEYGRVVPSLDLTPACPITGYRYGHAWLVRALPADVIATVQAIGQALDPSANTRDAVR
jgi:hypothetical protein